MLIFLEYSISIIGSYFLGSFPTAWIMGKCYGVNILSLGTRNMGASNTRKVLGWKPALIVLFVDLSKGFLPPWVSLLMFPHMPVVALVSALAAFLGHLYSLPLYILAKRLRGGIGVATALGSFFVVLPWIVIMVILSTFLISFLVTRFLALSNLFGVAAALVTVLVLYGFRDISFPYLLYTITILSAVFIKHLPHIRKLRQGQYQKFEFKSKPLIASR